MSKLAEDLLEAEQDLLQAEAASDAARRAEVEALVSGDAAGATERKKRLAAAASSLDSARAKAELLREAASVASERDAAAQRQAEVARRIAEQGSRQAALDRLEAALTQAFVQFAALASKRHEAAALLETSSRWLRQNVGEDVPGGLAAPASTTTLLDRVASASHAEIAAAVNGRETLVTCRIAVPIFRIVPTHQPTVEPKE